MRETLSSVLLCVLLPLAAGQEKQKDEKELSPSDVVKQWNSAAAQRDMETVTKLASKTVSKQSLEVIRRQGVLDYQGETRIVHEEIGGDRAVVIYRLAYRGTLFTEVKYGIKTLVREDGQWKVSREQGGVLKLSGKKPKAPPKAPPKSALDDAPIQAEPTK